MVGTRKCWVGGLWAGSKDGLQGCRVAGLRRCGAAGLKVCGRCGGAELLGWLRGGGGAELQGWMRGGGRPLLSVPPRPGVALGATERRRDRAELAGGAAGASLASAGASPQPYPGAEPG